MPISYCRQRRKCDTSREIWANAPNISLLLLPRLLRMARTPENFANKLCKQDMMWLSNTGSCCNW